MRPAALNVLHKYNIVSISMVFDECLYNEIFLIFVLISFRHIGVMAT